MSSRCWRGSIPAKINLTLHVLGKRDDGYHELESLVAFASIGDNLSITLRDDGDVDQAVTVSGPFAASVPSQNSVTAALQTVQDYLGRSLPVEIHLQKNLPVASGIGGGSADAAGCLRGLQALLDIAPDVIADLAPKLGADVPVCLASRSSWMTGIGHAVETVSGLPDIGIILVNPAIAVSTRSVFEALDASPVTAAPAPCPRFAAWDDWCGFMENTGNDLANMACCLHPEIKDLLEALHAAGADYVSMSGSGATCFALAPREAIAAIAARLDIPSSYWRATGCLVAAADAKIDEIEKH